MSAVELESLRSMVTLVGEVGQLGDLDSWLARLRSICDGLVASLPSLVDGVPELEDDIETDIGESCPLLDTPSVPILAIELDLEGSHRRNTIQR